MSQSVAFICEAARSAKENLSTLFNYRYNYKKYIIIYKFWKKKHQNTYIILIVYIEKGQIILRFLLKLLNLWLIILTNIHNIISFSIL